MDQREILDIFRQIRVAERKGHGAPHKPLLLLWALGRAQRGIPRLAHYGRVVEPSLKMLLSRLVEEPWRPQPHYPFWRLQGDGLWEITGASGVPLTNKGDVHVGALRQSNARGGFTKPVYRALTSNSGLVQGVAAILLNRHFPSAKHVAILASVGLVTFSCPQQPTAPVAGSSSS